MKKLFSFLLILVLTMTVFAGCGGKDSGNPYVPPDETGNNNDDNDDNGDEEDEVPTPTIKFSHEAGVYKEGFTLTITPAEQDNTIHYTLDLSDPIKNSTLYENGIEIVDRTNDLSYPLSSAARAYNVFGENDQYYRYTQNGFKKVSKGTVIKLLEVNKDGEIVSKHTLTYIIKPDADTYFTIPVVSVSAPLETWFGTNGIYNDLYNEEKVRAHIEYFDTVNKETFSLETQGKLGGNWTKQFPQRTLNMNFNKNDSGENNTPVKTDIFQGRLKGDNSGEVLTDITRFRLHNAGNDFQRLYLRDAFAQSLVKGEVYAETAGYRPCILYLNGEYWGYYGIREHYSDTYFADNFANVKKSDVVYLEIAASNGSEPSVQDGIQPDGSSRGDLKYWDELMSFCDTHTSFASSSVYNNFVNNYIDVDSFIDMILVHAYVGNWDFMYNNFRMWRVREKKGEGYLDGRWRFMLHDLDFAFEDAYVNYLPQYNGSQGLPWNGFYFPSHTTRLFRRLLTNSTFKKALYDRAVVLTQTVFKPSTAKAKFNSMINTISPFIPDTMLRWGDVNGNTPNTYRFNDEVVHVRNVLDARPAVFLSYLKSFLGY